MLLMVAVGVSNLIWMAFLAGIMLTERTLPGGDRIVRPLGATLIAVGVLVLVQPAWLPGDLSFLPNGDDSFLWWCA
jgi:predicted metal-binding membrane protein